MVLFLENILRGREVMKKILDSVKIKTRLLTLIISAIFGILTLFALSIFSSQWLSKDIKELNNSVLPTISASQEFRNNLTEVRSLLIEASIRGSHVNDLKVLQEKINRESSEKDSSDIATTKEDVYLGRTREIQEEITLLAETNNTDNITILEEHLNSEKGQELLEKLLTNLETYRDTRNAALELAVGGEDAEALFNQAIEYSNMIEQYVNELVDFTVSYGNSMTDSAVNLASKVIVSMCILVASIMIIVILISFFIIGSITGPIHIIKGGVSQMAEGDLTVEIPTHYKAEFGEMFTSFREMIGSLSVLILGVKSTYKNVHSSFVYMKNSTGKIDKSIADMDSFLNVLASDMGTQVTGLKESSVSMDGIANGIHQIAESSAAVAELATETSTQAYDGNIVIEKSVSQMETINQVVDNTSNVVGRLVKRTKTIDDALKAITTIAEQTNLLALNASIEAARAGEHGRGFAVVADEVSKLAAQSKESANEINVLLQEINEDTKEAVEAMEQGKVETKQGIDIIRQAGYAFSSIVEKVTTMTEQVQEVSATVEEMSAGTEEVNSSLSEIVRNSEAISSQTTEAVQRNNEQVDVVNGMVNMMNATEKDVGKLEENLHTFKTESEDEKNKLA